MEIEPIANNNVMITSKNGVKIEVSDDGDCISIRQMDDQLFRKIIKLNAVHYDYDDHHHGKPDHKINTDVIRIDKP